MIFISILWVDGVFLQHVSLPVVLPRKRFRALPRIVAPGLGAIETARLLVLVIDMTFEMCDGAKAQLTPCKGARPRPLMIPFVVAAVTVSLGSSGVESLATYLN